MATEVMTADEYMANAAEAHASSVRAYEECRGEAALRDHFVVLAIESGASKGAVARALGTDTAGVRKMVASHRRRSGV